MVALTCVALIAGCNDALPEESEPFEATEIDLVISDPDNPRAELTALIDFVSYQITCADSELIPGYNDAVTINGEFEVDLSDNPPVWELVTSLPPAPCTISLWVWYQNKVICAGNRTLSLIANGNPSTDNKFDILLECSLSVDGPSADVDVDGSFDFINGNYCPKLNWLGALPVVVPPVLPIETTLEVSAFDVDSTCGLNCDPQLCDFTQSPPVCSAAPDPGFSTTFIAPAGYGSFDAPVATGTQMVGGTPIDTAATYTCDPLVPGPTEICVIASDGDKDCDKMRCITIVCPDLCEGVDCTDFDQDGNPIECTRDRCNPLNGICSNDPAPDGIACNSCGSTCQNGACSGPRFAADVEFDGTTILSGTQQVYDETLVNPYSSASVPVRGSFMVNDLSYNGIGTADVLSGLMPGGTQSEVLLIKDLIHPQTVCGVETIDSLNGIDVILLADDFILLQNMVIEGGTAGDVLWANAGDDTVRGNQGNDLIDGGPGDDLIEGGLGSDTITLWPGSGFDSIDGGMDAMDRVEIDAVASQIRIAEGTFPYEFEVFYLGNPMAELVEVEVIDLIGASIDLTMCTGAEPDVCNLCGNDDLNGGEECDDGNNVDGDGCSATCVAEY